MATAKKTKTPAPAAIVIPMLTKPTGASTSKGEKLVLTGHEAVASRLRERAQQIDTLEAEQKIESAEIIAAAKILRREAEATGAFTKTVAVATEEGSPISLVFADKYSDVDVAHEPALRAALGASYDTCFRRQAKVKARGDLTVEKLQALLGDKFGAFCTAFDVTEYLTPVDGFMETRANMRRGMSNELNAAVDQVVDQVQYKPSVRLK